MRIVTNEAYIDTRKKIGERAPFVGLLVLAAATILVFWRPEWTWYSMILIWLGFIISIVGTYFGDRFVGVLAHHKKVPELLKGLDQSYTLLMYTAKVPFVLLEPGGVTTVTVRSHGGAVTFVDGGRWTHKEKMSFFRRFAGQEGLGRPDRLAAAEAETIRSFLREKLPEVDVPVRPVILFIDPRVQLDAAGSPVPALRGAELKRWLRKDGRLPRLPEETLTAVFQAFGVEA